MKALFKYICLASTVCLFAQCSDYLDTKNAGNTDNAFVTSTTDETFKLLSWCYGEYKSNVAAGGNYNFQDVVGSDAEYMNEWPTANNYMARMQPGSTGITTMNGQYNSLTTVLARAARIADAIAENAQYQNDAKGSTATDWTQLYGEAVTLWAHCYFKLTLHWGDVPFGYENQAVTEYELSSRFDIYDNIIARLKEVEGLMYTVGSGGITAERINRSYANALIGEISLYSGGYQTIRTDMPGLYGDVQFDYIGSDDGECVYARRKDYLTYITQAEKYLDLAVNSLNGSARLVTTDTRGGIDNPFQFIWSEINSRRISPESFFEIGTAAGVGNAEHPYSQGRPGSNNGANSLLNTFAAIRIIPTFFYTGYEDGDKRRDASMVVTGSNASTGEEAFLVFGGTTRIGGGGPAINKWDHNKADVPNYPTAGNRSSGMNYTILRMADAMLLLAEAKALLGDDAGAISLVNKIRARAFGDETHAISGLTGEKLLDAIWNERKLELLGEGDVRWDMIRSGKMNTRAIAVRKEVSDMIDGLKKDGYYKFANGKTMGYYVWTKLVYLDGVSSTGVTYDNTDETNPVTTPGWRGIWDWKNKGAIATYKDGPKNLAIKGLYEYIDPDGAEAKALEADGYTRINWGKNIVDNMNDGIYIYTQSILDGVKGREDKAPRYFFPLPATVLDQSKGTVTNGYGLPQK